MGNGLGAMIFLAGGLYLGYWVLTGRAANFLYALKNGQQNPNGGGGSTTPNTWNNPNVVSGQQNVTLPNGPNTLSGNPTTTQGPLMSPGVGLG